jgi:hypothetical protein
MRVGWPVPGRRCLDAPSACWPRSRAMKCSSVSAFSTGIRSRHSFRRSGTVRPALVPRSPSDPCYLADSMDGNHQSTIKQSPNTDQLRNRTDSVPAGALQATRERYDAEQAIGSIWVNGDTAKGRGSARMLREASPTGRLRLRRSALFVVFRFSTENHANRRALKRMQGAVR